MLLLALCFMVLVHEQQASLILPNSFTDSMEVVDDATKLRSDFLNVLRSRRSPEVPLSVELGKPRRNAWCHEIATPCPAMKNIKEVDDEFREENLYLITEASEQGRVPVLILSKEEIKKRPAVVILHSTGLCKESMRPLLESYAAQGYISVSIDSRYGGERGNRSTYNDALVQSWKTGDTMPFIYDTVWDLIKLADYLTQREDIDPSKIGITGVSLGGMHAWFAAFVDTRYAVVVPIIGVQGFRWAIDNDKWQARVDSIKPVFEEAHIDLGKDKIDKEVVEKVWDRITPGLASKFDAPFTIPLMAPRPLLILNGADDPRCPIEGLRTPVSKARKAYEVANSSDSFKMIAQPRIGHELTELMLKEASDWFHKFLM